MTQRVYVLGADSNRDVVLQSSLDYFHTHFIAKPMAGAWKSPTIKIVGKTKRLRDFVSWMNAAPVISARAKEALEQMVTPHCEILPLTELRGEPYYALNVISTIDCLDYANSDIVYADDDTTHILMIHRYALHADRIASSTPIFKLPEHTNSVFVTEPFVDCVITGKLRGAAFLDPASNPFGKIIRGESLNVVDGLTN